jgi:hypothetical protein
MQAQMTFAIMHLYIVVVYFGAFQEDLLLGVGGM